MNEFRFYLVGGHFTAWTDHEPIIGIYNNNQRKTSKRISNHRDNVGDLNFTMKYMSGKEMPCDYGSRHPRTISHLATTEQERLGFDTGNSIYVMKINFEDSPDAIKIKEIREIASKDEAYMTTMEQVKKGCTNKKAIPKEYQKVFNELCICNNILMKGDQIVLPNAERGVGEGNIRSQILDIAHQGHPGTSAMKRQLRSRVWFPNMDMEVMSIVSGCLACQASTPRQHRDPLIPSDPPKKPWEKLGADHWGPTPDGKHILAVIDMLSKYPEVAITKDTSAEENIVALDEILSRHGFCDTLRTDNGPPWNSHLMKEYLKWAGIKHEPTKSAEDPEANGLVEAFMKHLQKIYHTAYIERKNPKEEINKHLRMFRATPHSSTGKIPAEILFGRKYNNRLPDIKTENRQDIEEARSRETSQKAKQKVYKDSKPYVREHTINVGDTVLLKQKKSKRNPPYDPDPYTVIEIRGHQITAVRDQTLKTRDSQRWKKVTITPNVDYQQMRQRRYQLTDSDNEILDMAELDKNTSVVDVEQHRDDRRATSPINTPQIGNDVEGLELQRIPERRAPSTRSRRPPPRYRDYIAKILSAEI